MKTRTSIVVRFTFEGVHQWPDAPQDRPEFYLKHPHRHVFHVEAKKDVSHGNRDIEFINLKFHMTEFCKDRFGVPRVITESCEQMALAILQHFSLQSCSVFEDGENGAVVEVEESRLSDDDRESMKVVLREIRDLQSSVKSTLFGS